MYALSVFVFVCFGHLNVLGCVVPCNRSATISVELVGAVAAFRVSTLLITVTALKSWSCTKLVLYLMSFGSSLVYNKLFTFEYGTSEYFLHLTEIS